MNSFSSNCNCNRLFLLLGQFCAALVHETYIYSSILFQNFVGAKYINRHEIQCTDEEREGTMNLDNELPLALETYKARYQESLYLLIKSIGTTSVLSLLTRRNLGTQDKILCQLVKTFYARNWFLFDNFIVRTSIQTFCRTTGHDFDYRNSSSV